MFKTKIMWNAVLILVFSSLFSPANAEKSLTIEYSELRNKIYKRLITPYRSCKNKYAVAYRREFFDKCIHDQETKIPLDRCGHEASRATDKMINNGEFETNCISLKPDKEYFFNLVDDAAKKAGINKFKNET